MSKLAINILTKIQQKNFDDSNNETPGLIVNSVCPGETGLKNTFFYFKITVFNNYILIGAASIVDLALLPSDYTGYKGGFYIEKDLVDWQTGYLLVQKFD